MEASLILPNIGQHSFTMKRLNRKKNVRSILIFSTIVTDILAIILGFAIASLIRLSYIHYDQITNIYTAILPIYLAIGLNNRAFRSNILTDLWKNLTRGVTAFLLAAGSMLLILFFFKTSAEFSRLMFGLGILSSMILLAGFRSASFAISQRIFEGSPYADLCIYDSVTYPKSASDSALSAKDLGLTADPSDVDSVKRLANIAVGMDRIIIHCLENNRANWVFMLRSLDVPSEIVVPELDLIAPLDVRRRNGRTSLLISTGQLRKDQQITKRAFDLFMTIASLPLLIPFMALVAIAIKLDSPGPILFRQHRIGLGNRSFEILKFRSMKFENTDHAGQISTARDDHRVTRIGRFIRRTSIDELPQIFNVLAGDMSIIGPRPHALGSKADDFLFWDIDQRYWHRHVVKPGLTGLAQIRGYRGATEQQSDLSNRLQSDLEYLAGWSLWNDIKIFLKTFFVLFHKNAF